MSRLLERVERWEPRLCCAGGWAACAELIPPGRLFVGKEGTHGIERDHSRQRHWPARSRRRTCVVSKAVRMVEASIALFVRSADDRGIGGSVPLTMVGGLLTLGGEALLRMGRAYHSVPFRGRNGTL